MTPLRVLWLTDSLTLGGAEALTVAFARNRDPDRVDLRVAYLKLLGSSPFDEELRGLGIDVTRLDASNLRDVRAFRRLVRLLRDQRIDVLHTHLAYASMWGALAGAIVGTPVATTFHVAPPLDPFWTREGMRRCLRIRLANAFARRNVAVSRAAADAWIRKGLDPGKTQVIHNGVPVEVFARDRGADAEERIRRELGISPEVPLLVTVSVLREGKGLDDLVIAMEHLVTTGREGALAVAGDGPLRHDLERDVRNRGLGSRVRFLGFHRDVPALLGAADLFVLPSRWDAFPTAVLEAMAAGVAVVATRVGGIPEMVDDGVTGMLVEPGNPEELGEALGRLVEHTDLALRLGRAGRERARERFSVETWRDRLCTLYEELAGTSRETA